MAVIRARNLRKTYGETVALEGIDLEVGEGRIVGLLGPNGAGKSTALQAILGLVSHEGDLRVLGRDPWVERGPLMRDVCFIADVAVLPRWMRVRKALDYMAGVHPRFDRKRAEAFLARTAVRHDAWVRELSKGMVTQLHLALIMAVDAKLLVLDEPTLGLDLLYRKQFYDTLLGDYVDQVRTIVVSTHDLYEVQHILTDVVMLDRGRVVLAATVEEIEGRFAEVAVAPEILAAARALGPIAERTLFGRSVLVFDGVDRERLEPLGEVRTPGLHDLFLAVMAPASGVERAA
ncbi:MAG TPA: ABC transporter ATP-binding protein [Caulobacteraceae bacterium]|nr:ABC transporter ATP-binding protein [Caulobacteraceae bacterium]